MSKEFLDRTWTVRDEAPLFSKGSRFESCHFEGLNLSDVSFARVGFEDCTFLNCNLSGLVVTGAALRQVYLKSCKALGVRWDTCNPFGFIISALDSQLDYGVFTGCQLMDSRFDACSFREADFTSANCERLEWNDCDLQGAQFYSTRLVNCDFRGAISCAMDPSKNAMNGAQFRLDNAPGLLAHWGILIDGYSDS